MRRGCNASLEPFAMLMVVRNDAVFFLFVVKTVLFGYCFPQNQKKTYMFVLLPANLPHRRIFSGFSHVRMVSGIFSSAILLLAIEIGVSDSSGRSRTSFVAGLKKESESTLWSAQLVSLPSLSDVID